MKKLLLGISLILLSSSAYAQQIDVAFSPPGCAPLVIKTINSANSTIRVAAYGFDYIPIIDELIRKHTAGVDVQVVLDKSDLNGKKVGLSMLKDANIPVRIDSVHSIMHNKFMIIDGQTVELGSYNYTNNAERHNAENVSVIHNDSDMAGTYTTYWNQLWNESKDYTGN